MVAGDQVAVVARLDRVGSGAIGTGLAQADNLARYEIGAAIVDGLVVGYGELVANGEGEVRGIAKVAIERATHLETL